MYRNRLYRIFFLLGLMLAGGFLANMVYHSESLLAANSVNPNPKECTHGTPEKPADQPCVVDAYAAVCVGNNPVLSKQAGYSWEPEYCPKCSGIISYKKVPHVITSSGDLSKPGGTYTLSCSSCGTLSSTIVNDHEWVFDHKEKCTEEPGPSRKYCTFASVPFTPDGYNVLICSRCKQEKMEYHSGVKHGEQSVLDHEYGFRCGDEKHSCLLGFAIIGHNPRYCKNDPGCGSFGTIRVAKGQPLNIPAVNVGQDTTRCKRKNCNLVVDTFEHKIPVKVINTNVKGSYRYVCDHGCDVGTVIVYDPNEPEDRNPAEITASCTGGCDSDGNCNSASEEDLAHQRSGEVPLFLYVEGGAPGWDVHRTEFTVGGNSVENKAPCDHARSGVFWYPMGQIFNCSAKVWERFKYGVGPSRDHSWFASKIFPAMGKTDESGTRYEPNYPGFYGHYEWAGAKNLVLFNPTNLIGWDCDLDTDIAADYGARTALLFTTKLTLTEGEGASQAETVTTPVTLNIINFQAMKGSGLSAVNYAKQELRGGRLVIDAMGAVTVTNAAGDNICAWDYPANNHGNLFDEYTAEDYPFTVTAEKNEGYFISTRFNVYVNNVDSGHLYFPLDLDIDSDNNDGVSEPDESYSLEDAIENDDNQNGKMIPVSIPGSIVQGGPDNPILVPINIEVANCTDRATIVFNINEPDTNESRIRLWKKNENRNSSSVADGGDWIVFGETYKPAELGISGEFTDVSFYVEATDVALPTTKERITVTYDCDSADDVAAVSDTVTVSGVNLDLDVDSDNDNGDGLFEMNEKEDLIEHAADQPGKLVTVVNGDSDGDGVPDFADMDTENPPMIPVVLKLNGAKESVGLVFHYSASNPKDMTITEQADGSKSYQLPATGKFRLWRGAHRGMTDAKEQGWFIRPDVVYTGEELGLVQTDEEKKVTFYLEAVQPGSGTIKVQLANSAGEANSIVYDAVKVSGISMEFVVPSSYDSNGRPTGAPVPTEFVGVSDPRPTIQFEGEVTSEISGDQVIVHVPQITVRDPIADNVPRGGGADIETISYSVDGGEAKTLKVTSGNDGASTFWRQHPYKGTVNAFDIALPKKEGVSDIFISTGVNAAGNTANLSVHSACSKTTYQLSATGDAYSASNNWYYNIFIKNDLLTTVKDKMSFFAGDRAPCIQTINGIENGIDWTVIESSESSLCFSFVNYFGYTLAVNILSVKAKNPAYRTDATAGTQEAQEFIMRSPVNGGFALNSDFSDQFIAHVVVTNKNGTIISNNDIIFTEKAFDMAGEDGTVVSYTNENSRLFQTSIMLPCITEKYTYDNNGYNWKTSVDYEKSTQSEPCKMFSLRISGCGNISESLLQKSCVSLCGRSFKLEKASDGSLYLKGGSKQFPVLTLRDNKPVLLFYDTETKKYVAPSDAPQLVDWYSSDAVFRMGEINQNIAKAKLQVLDTFICEVQPNGVTYPTKKIVNSQSNPEITIEKTTITNIRPNSGKTALIADVEVSGRVTSEICDLVSGDDGVIDAVQLCINGTKINEMETGVSKQVNSASFYKPYPFAGSFSCKLTGVAVQEGPNVISCYAQDKIYEYIGESEVSVAIIGTPPAIFDESTELGDYTGYSFSVDNAIVLKKPSKGEVHPYVLQIIGPKSVIESRVNTVVVNGKTKWKIVKGIDGKYYAKVEQENPTTSDTIPTIILSVGKNQSTISGTIQSGVKRYYDFHHGFCDGFISDGLCTMIIDINDSRIAIGEEIGRLWSYDIIMNNGDEYKSERMLFTNAADSVSTMAKFAYKIQCESINGTMAGLRGDWEGVYDVTPTQQMVFSLGSDLIQALAKDFASAEPYEQGQVLGQGAFEIASCILSMTKVSKVGIIKKLDFLNALKSSKLFKLGRGGAPALERVIKKCSGLANTIMCFPEGTSVHTVNGQMPIEKITPGTYVLSREQETGVQAFKPVVQTIVTHPSSLYHVSYRPRSAHTVGGNKVVASAEAAEPDSSTEQIDCTGAHPFYLVNRQDFVPAVDIRVGDILQLADGREAEITEVTSSPLKEAINTYNIVVADFHTYFVGQNGVWVHNSSKLSCENMYVIYQHYRETLKPWDAYKELIKTFPTKAECNWKNLGLAADEAMQETYALAARGEGAVPTYTQIREVMEGRQMISVDGVERFNAEMSDVHHVIPKWILKQLKLPEPLLDLDNTPGFLLTKDAHTIGTEALHKLINEELSKVDDLSSCGKVSKALSIAYIRADNPNLAKVAAQWLLKAGGSE